MTHTHTNRVRRSDADEQLIQDKNSVPPPVVQALEDDSERKRTSLEDVTIQMKRIRKGSLPNSSKQSSSSRTPLTASGIHAGIRHGRT